MSHSGKEQRHKKVIKRQKLSEFGRIVRLEDARGKFPHHSDHWCLKGKNPPGENGRN